ncbi:hypothetical protein [Prochlorococcus marinus]|uniref:hypothetical protein n=1 Tax=Prochlorococcus marinus TaxID=1219 RepID=UPI001ADD0D5C|nr:hypothetical protein [Prochlorococcus marinus]MBO8204942.1 hypothetical protein [Prochlorococcus marinus CUG1415]MBW3044214.1 hypothetical protein [Prochlorococcus marinus str. MU1415]
MISILALGFIGALINFINSLFLENTPFYFSIVSILSFSIGLKYSTNEKVTDSIHNSFLFFGLINFLTAISQILVGLFKFNPDLLIYGVGLGPGDAPWAYLSRPTGLFSNPFSLGVLGAILIAIPKKENFLIFRIVGFSLVLLSLSRAYLGLTFCHLLFWVLKKSFDSVMKKSSSLLIGISILTFQILLLRTYLENSPSDSFTYKYKAIPSLIGVFINNPLSILFGFSKSNENEFFSYLDTNTLFISDSYESWFLRLIIFGGIFLALIYIYPLIRVFLLSIKNTELLFSTSSLIITSLASFVSNGGFGGLISWIYFYLIANIYVIGNIKKIRASR